MPFTKQNIFEKYNPCSLDQLHFHQHVIEKLRKHVIKPKNRRRLIVLHGKGNLGKTKLISIFLKHHKFTPTIIDSCELYAKNMKHIKQLVRNIFNNNGVNQYFSKIQKQCLVIENFRHDSMPILKYLGSFKCIPFPVIISTRLQPNSISYTPRPIFLYMSPLSLKEKQTYISRLLKEECVNVDPTDVEEICKCVTTYFDILNCFQAMMSLKNNRANQNNNSLSSQTIADILQSQVVRADSLINKKEQFKDLIQNHSTKSSEEIQQIWEYETTYMNQVLFHNMPLKSLTQMDKLRLDCFLMGKKCESFLYTHQCWELYSYLPILNLCLLHFYTQNSTQRVECVPRINSKLCQHYYQKKTKQSITSIFGSSSVFMYLLCDCILFHVFAGKKKRKEFMTEHNLERKQINEIKRLSLTTYPKIKY